MADQLSPGQIIDVTGTNRRKFIRSLAVAGTGVRGLKSAVEDVYGRTDGAPLVYTRDTNGNPKRIKIVSKETHRRLQIFRNYPVSWLKNRYPVVNGMRIGSNSGSGPPTFELLVDPGVKNVGSKLPNRIKDVPVDWSVHQTTKQTHWCDDHTGTVSPVEGGVQIHRSNGEAGTLALVCWDSQDDSEVLVTCWHAMDNDEHMYQGGRSIGTFVSSDPGGDDGNDVTKYGVKSSISVETLDTLESSVPDVNGIWTFSGLTDHISNNGTLPCTLSGAKSCTVSNEVNDTQRNDGVKYSVEMLYQRAQAGDSGGPWVDDNGDLVALHKGVETGSYGIDSWDLGSCAKPALDAVNATISN